MELVQAKNEATGRDSEVLPSEQDLLMVQELYVKIGARGEIPDNPQMAVNYLVGVWRAMYFENRYVPEDIPSDIIFEQFTKALLYGDVERKGNNQASIISCFTKWIKNPEVCKTLYKVRDNKYPNQKPKQLQARNYQSNPSEYDLRGLKVQDFPDGAIKEQYEQIMKMYDDDTIKHVSALGARSYTYKVIEEAKRRGFAD